MATTRRLASAPAFAATILIAFAIAAINPYRALLFSPILFGAPHAISDIWYLIVRESGVTLKVRIALAALSALVLSTAGLLVLGINVPVFVDSLFLTTLLAVPLALTVPVDRAVGQWLIVFAIGSILLATNFPLRGIVAQLHNVIALVFLFSLAWPIWGKRTVAVLAGGIAAVLAIGTAISITNHAVFTTQVTKSWSPFQSLSIGLKGPLGDALIFAYAVLQLLHFAVWIGFIPWLKGDITPKKVARAFGFGVPLIGGILLLVAIVAAPLAATLDPLKARQAYLTLVSFHGWMEIAWLLAHSASLKKEQRFSLRNTFAIESSS